MIIQREIRFDAGQGTEVILRFNHSLTRIANGVRNERTTVGFTKYFKALKKEVERTGKQDDYIFIFNMQDYKRRKDTIWTAEGKIIVIDNTEVLAASDEDFRENGGFRRLSERNQVIVKEFMGDDGKYILLDRESMNDTAYLMEFTKAKADGTKYKEIRLLYHKRFDYDDSDTWLFIDRRMAEEVGFEIVRIGTSLTSMSGLEMFEALDISDYDETATRALLEQTDRMRLYSNKEETMQWIDDFKVYIADSETIKGTIYLSDYDSKDVAKLLYSIAQKAEHAEFIGGLWNMGHPIKNTEVYLWRSKRPSEEGKDFATLVLFPGLQELTYEVNTYGSRYGLRGYELHGLLPGDYHLMMKYMLQILKSRHRLTMGMEG